MLNTTVIIEEVFEEELNGVIDGSNSIFTTNHNFKPDTLKLYLNGLRQRKGINNDFIITSNNEIVLNEPPLPGDSIIADYIKI